MSESVYDTRFLVEYFYSKDKQLLERAKQELAKISERFISVITLHELYVLTLKKEGGDVANLRREAVKPQFRTVPIDDRIAIQAAVFRQKYDIPMADSLIAATSYLIRAICVTDDKHIAKIREIKTRWIE